MKEFETIWQEAEINGVPGHIIDVDACAGLRIFLYKPNWRYSYDIRDIRTGQIILSGEQYTDRNTAATEAVRAMYKFLHAQAVALEEAAFALRAKTGVTDVHRREG